MELLKALPVIDYAGVFGANESYLAQTASVRHHLAEMMRGPHVVGDTASAFVGGSYVENSVGANLKLNLCPSLPALNISARPLGDRHSISFVAKDY